uniref:Immunoglobulin domain-containing protein n=1 Tax=Salarias fasciatus TaxID=181472 RepID=A0A672IW39_SALFA
MNFYFYILFLLSGLTGQWHPSIKTNIAYVSWEYFVTTVTKVSVKAGRSLSIPCLYGTQYRNLVKYLCKGYRWRSCSYVIKTDGQRKPKKFSISDDKDQSIFTVTIRELTNADSHFWCAVEIDSNYDAGEYFHLSVTTGKTTYPCSPILSVTDQKITGFVGKNVSIEFHNCISDRLQWCRLGGACVENPSGLMDGTRVIINKTGHKDFTVTLSGLKLESGGWYLCSSGEYQMPVHLSVYGKPTSSKFHWLYLLL